MQSALTYSINKKSYLQEKTQKFYASFCFILINQKYVTAAFLRRQTCTL